MSPGRPAPRAPPAGGSLPASGRSSGGFTFAEDPALAAPEARIIWEAGLDPTTLTVAAVPGSRDDPEHVDLELLAPWLTLVADIAGREHGVLSDGRHHLRFDVTEGSLLQGDPVVLHYHLRGLTSAQSLLLPLRRLIDLCRHRRFASHLFPDDPRIERWLLALRVHDALQAGASQREIAIELYGADRVGSGWEGGAESLRLRVRRLARDARALAAGGYRALLRKGG